MVAAASTNNIFSLGLFSQEIRSTIFATDFRAVGVICWKVYE